MKAEQNPAQNISVDGALNHMNVAASLRHTNGCRNQFPERWGNLSKESQDKIWEVCLKKSWKTRCEDAGLERAKFLTEDISMQRKRMKDPKNKKKFIDTSGATLCESFEELEGCLGELVDDDNSSKSILFMKKQLILAKNDYALKGYYVPNCDAISKKFKEKEVDAFLLENWRFHEWRDENEVDLKQYT